MIVKLCDHGAMSLLMVTLAVNASMSFAGGNQYNVANIPQDVVKNASAVVRQHTTSFEIKDERRAVLKIKKAVTIFKREERRYGELELWYDQFTEIEDLDGTLYDVNGEEIRDLKDTDVNDYSAFSDYSLYANTRVKLASLYYDRYPYTVEFTYEIQLNASLNWRRWHAQETLDPVEYARFEVNTPRDYELRYWCNRDSIRPQISEKGKRTYVWEAQHLPALSKDIVGEDPEDFTTIVLIAPSSFEIAGYKGDMASWKSFGSWYYQLTQGRDKLPESAAKEVHALVQTTDDVGTKVEKLYKYLQSRTRYVSVQLGIGGWQPFDALYVHERGYGDCKALTNYMAALLKEADVTAYPVLIQNGYYRLPMITEFPSNQFNHAILCVPTEKDSIWLECTSQSIPVGLIGSSNENRYALMVTPEGGAVVRTPTSTSTQNLQKRVATVDLLGDGSGKAFIRTLVTGNQQNDVRNELHNASPEERLKWILNELQIPNAKLLEFTIGGLDARQPQISLNISLELPQFASFSSNRMFFQPNLTERMTYVPPDIEKRLSPIRFVYAYYDIDSVIYNIPRSLVPEAIPGEVYFKSLFGSFSEHTIAVGDTALIFTRELEISQLNIPPEEYFEYRKFFSEIVKADRASVVLVRRKN